MTLMTEHALLKRPLGDVFNEVATHARDAHLQLGNLVIMSKAGPMYVPPYLRDHLTQHGDELQSKLEEHNAYMAKAKYRGMVSYEEIGGTRITWLDVDTALEGEAPLSKKYPQQMDILYTLLHEIGHMVVHEGRGNEDKHMQECAADAYAFLRLFQMFGDISDYCQDIAARNAAATVVKASPIHYTSRVLQKICQIKDDMGFDIYNLDAGQTARLAGDIARHYCFTKAELNRIHNGFTTSRALYRQATEAKKDVNWADVIRAIGTIMREMKEDHDVYRAGKLYLSSVEGAAHLATVTQNDPSFISLFSFIPVFEKQSGIILNTAQALSAKNRTAPRAFSMEKPS